MKLKGGAIQLKSDPYAACTELPPASASVVKDLRNYAWDDAAWMDAREKYKDRHQPVSIYETSLTVWKNAQELVDYVKELKYTHVELHPVMEYLDEDAGKSVAPYMSQPLETAADFIGEEEDVAGEEVECKLPLEEMRMLKEEQEELDRTYPAVDAVSRAVTPDDLDNAGNVLFKLNDADKDEEKSLRAALTLHTIRETDLFEIFSSQVENKNVIDSLMGKYLDGDGTPLPVRKTKSVVPVSDGGKQYL